MQCQAEVQPVIHSIHKGGVGQQRGKEAFTS